MFMESNGKLYWCNSRVDVVHVEGKSDAESTLDADNSRKVRELIKKEQATELCKMYSRVEEIALNFSNGKLFLPEGVNEKMREACEPYLKGLYAMAVMLNENETKLYFHLGEIRQDLYQLDMKSKGGCVWVSWNLLLKESPELTEENLSYMLNSPLGKKYIYTRNRMCSSRIWPNGSDFVIPAPKANEVFEKRSIYDGPSQPSKPLPKTEKRQVGWWGRMDSWDK